jgi:pantothenate kinase
MTIEIQGLESALERLLLLSQNSSSRVIVGLVGKPGAGKSTLSNYLLKKLPKETTTLVPMDGYHLSNLQLKQLGRSDRKGAPDTFDSFGFLHLLQRIKMSTDEEIYFPVFHREMEESIASEGVVHPHTSLILVEGNYLLLDNDGWLGVAKTLTESWFIDVDNDRRMARLVARHIKYGKSLEEAHAWAHGSDQKNSDLVELTRQKADVVIHLD